MTRTLFTITALCSIALTATGCSVGFGQFGTNTSKSCPLFSASGPCTFYAQRNIGGVTHEFNGVEQTSRLEAVHMGSVVQWVDAETGAIHITRVPCIGGLIPGVLFGGTEILGDECLDDVSVSDHARQLPGDLG